MFHERLALKSFSPKLLQLRLSDSHILREFHNPESTHFYLGIFWRQISSASISKPVTDWTHAVGDTIVDGEMEAFEHSQPAEVVIAKKKRKRPSRKAPTTMFDATSDDFMNLVQQLTGTVEERAAAQGSKSLLAKSTSETSTHRSLSAHPSKPSPSQPSPSLPHAQSDSRNQPNLQQISSDLYHDLYLQYLNMIGSGNQVDSGFPPSNICNPTPHSSAQYMPSGYQFQGAALWNGLNHNEEAKSSGKEQLSNDLNCDHSNRSKYTWDALCPSTSSTVPEDDVPQFSYQSHQMNNPFFDWYSADRYAPIRT